MKRFEPLVRLGTVKMCINRLKMSIQRFLQEEDGPTAVEYAVILALILMAIIAGVGTVGGGTANLWENNSNEISNAISGS